MREEPVHPELIDKNNGYHDKGHAKHDLERKRTGCAVESCESSQRIQRGDEHAWEHPRDPEEGHADNE